ncbi:unnamed protein product [Bursaphelenchus xylophilus]|uniref:(pine wood nematode) hypothetical protein n=1 Tax=Bursaphelenchus xylophilus TaxID=6326 RepID=A0A1I7S3I5_BURXY|nr:unnamed protein product [Bursaphelenchus xylophilus]CAG9116332.1 unnamed protein product [Bursaphelenchus xylophilus]
MVLPSTSANSSGIPLENWMRNKPFVSAQRRYDNARVREHEIKQRICEECGKVISGGDSIFQHHVVSHEAAFICYQLYHFEKGNIMPRSYFGKHEAKHQKQENKSPIKVEEPSPSSEKRSFRKTILSQHIKERPAKKPKITPAFKPAPREERFIQDEVVEPQLSSESDTTESTDDEEVPELITGSSESDSEGSYVEEEMPDEYRSLAQGTSSRGRQRKPRPII